jgi:LuxR family transcriptional regulator, maltose regulon positive regulatory protein
MARLCVKALEAGIEVDYVRELIRTRRLVPEIPPVHLEAWPWPIRLFTLGRFQIVRDDVPVTFHGKVPRKPLAVLQMLVAGNHGGLAEAQLLDALWPDADGDAALQALAMALHRLRAILGVEGTLTRHAGRVALDPRVCWVDVHAFEHALTAAEQALTSVRPDASSGVEARHWTKKGAELYRGPFLGEDGVQPWAAPTADRLRARWVRHLCTLTDHWIRTERWEDAIETCLTAIEADACAEPAYVRLMTAYARTGRRAEASRAYERCRAALATGLGLTPSRDLEALHQTLRAP